MMTATEIQETLASPGSFLGFKTHFCVFCVYSVLLCYQRCTGRLGRVSPHRSCRQDRYAYSWLAISAKVLVLTLLAARWFCQIYVVYGSSWRSNCLLFCLQRPPAPSPRAHLSSHTPPGPPAPQWATSPPSRTDSPAGVLLHLAPAYFM